MDARLTASIERHADCRVTGATPLSGGDINQAHAVTLDDGRKVFVKSHPNPPAGMFGCEAEGLRWLARPGPLRVPQVLAASDGEDGSSPFLMLEWIERGAAAPDHDVQLGEGLARLHQSGAEHFGFARDNYIATLEQQNTPCSDWPSFYRERRLRPQLERAMQRGLVPGALRRDFERLFGRLSQLCGPAEPPAPLHGDLWGGNAVCDARGVPVLIDPAVYGGHREIDLAMMKLFGGFGPRVFEAYHANFPLAPGFQERVPLYQLYPLLVHVNLFGGSYLSQVRAALARLV